MIDTVFDTRRLGDSEILTLGKSHTLEWNTLPLFMSPDDKNYDTRLKYFKEIYSGLKGYPEILQIGPTDFGYSEAISIIGQARSNYLVNINKWIMPLDMEGRDITKQDSGQYTTHHILTTGISNQEILAACRTITSPPVKNVDDLPFLATNELNGLTLNGNLPSVNDVLEIKMESDIRLRDAVQNGRIATIERLVPTILTSYIASGEPRRTVSFAQASIGAVAVSAAAYLRSKEVSHIILQADDRYKKHYQETLGIPDKQVICERTHFLNDGTPDPCHTMILDLEEAEEFTRVHNPPVYAFYMSELSTFSSQIL